MSQAPEPGPQPPAPPDPAPPGEPQAQSSLGLGAEVGRGGRGALALLAGDPAWPRWYNLSTRGFLRSFLAPLLALPLYVLSSALVTRALTDGQPVPQSLLWSAGLAHLVDAFGFPLLIGLIARPLGIGGGYPAFVIVTNWGSLYFNLLLLAGSLLVLAGRDGLEAFSLLTLILLCLSVLFVWRAARVTLSQEFAPTLLVVVLSVAVSAAADWGVQQFV